jgi:hypothetical protein
MNERSNLRRTLLVLAVLLAALLGSTSTGPGARAYGSCEDQCQQQFNECRRLGIDYYTCDQQRNYCLYHCGSSAAR